LLIVNFDEQLIILHCKRIKEEEKEKHAKKKQWEGLLSSPFLQ
jgi:hypothetical protein